uniref:F-box domain-containing protein n=2 Tax=Chenopodium quinoa TaxID=63459 RepID=A0A803KVD2_CHEQI
MDDLISNLPKDVRYGIMERLPLRDAARMSTLSKQWKEAWKTLPSLVFDGEFFREVLGKKRYIKLEYTNIVSKILLQHDGPIAKFSLHIPRHIQKHPDDVVLWIMNLSMNCINDFTLNNWKYSSPFKLPSQLFGCTNLTVLKLDYCIFNPPSSFKGFPKLVCNYLENIHFPSDDVVGSFVAKCPSLEKLVIQGEDGNDELPNLVINAPNLKYLTISSTFHSICLDGSEALSSVSFTLQKLVDQKKKRTRNMIKFLTSTCRIENLSFRKHFVKVKISENTADSVEDNWSCNLSSKFLQLRSIDVRLNSGSAEELKLVEFLLACSPVLHTFNLEFFEELDVDDKMKMSKKLMQFHRAFSNITVFLIFIEGKCDR